MLRLYLSRTADGKMDARALLERALADRGLEQMPAVERAPGGKPYFPDRPELCFSLSHSGPWALCALGDGPVGADVETVRPRREALLRALSQQVGQLPTQEQTEALARDVAQMRAELKQAGKKRERHFSLPRLRLPKLRLPDISWSSLLLGLTALALTGGVLWVVWFSWEKLWSATQTLIP